MTQAKSDLRNYIDASSSPLIETLRVARPTTMMRSKPRPSAGASTELIFGEFFHVHEMGRGWVWGRCENPLQGSAYPGYVGWVRRSDLADLSGYPSHRITSVSAPVFSSAFIKSPVKYRLPLGASLAGELIEDFIQTDIGFIHREHAASLDEDSRHGDWVSIAEALLGQPYIWGGVSSFGLDCSGLVQTALRNFRRDAPRDSDQQDAIGQAVPINEALSNLERGDLIFWKGHVGIMQSATRLIHANAHHMKVASEPLKTAVNRIQKSAGAITAIRRLIF